MPYADKPRFSYVDETTAVISWRSMIFTVWGWRPLTVESAREQCRACEMRAREVGEKKLVEVVLLHPQAPVPDGPVRDVLDQAATRIAPFYACVATLFQGTGFRSAFIRGVLTSLQLVSRTSFPQKVFEDAEACVAFASMHALKANPASAVDPALLSEVIADVCSMAIERDLWA